MQRKKSKTKQSKKQAVKTPPAKKTKKITKVTKKPPKKTVKSSADKTSKKSSSLFKFRRYKKLEGGKGKKDKHPKLIVEETDSKFGFMGLTEEDRSGHHMNIPIKNPKKGDKRKSFLRKELRYDVQDNFDEILKNYKLSEKDKKAVIKFVEKRKKKK